MKTIKYLIEEVIKLKIELNEFQSREYKLKNELSAAKTEMQRAHNELINLKIELTNLRLIINTKQEENEE